MRELVYVPNLAVLVFKTKTSFTRAVPRIIHVRHLDFVDVQVEPRRPSTIAHIDIPLTLWYAGNFGFSNNYFVGGNAPVPRTYIHNRIAVDT